MRHTIRRYLKNRKQTETKPNKNCKDLTLGEMENAVLGN